MKGEKGHAGVRKNGEVEVLTSEKNRKICREEYERKITESLDGRAVNVGMQLWVNVFKMFERNTIKGCTISS